MNTILGVQLAFAQYQPIQNSNLSHDLSYIKNLDIKVIRDLTRESTTIVLCNHLLREQAPLFLNNYNIRREERTILPLVSYKKRMPWILCNMFGGIACAVVSYIFQMVLGKILILAMFIPLVLSLSESISMQSMMQSCQMSRKQHISLKKALLFMCLEIRVASLMALSSGALVTCISLFWEPKYQVSLIMGVGVALSIVFSSLVGTGIPLFLHLKKLDPRVASGPIVLTIADLLTTVTYLSLATWFLL